MPAESTGGSTKMNKKDVKLYLDSVENHLSNRMDIYDFNKFMILLTKEMQERYGEDAEPRNTGFSLFPDIPTA